jgi:GTP diphosphokinase / guanosine-3',5'-bis(diphosphate) 3'-diphosphatase
VKGLKIEIGAEALSSALKRLKLPDQPALFVALASQAVTDAQLMEALVPGSAAKRKARRKSPPKSAEGTILVDGDAHAGVMEMAQCCMPVPGDRIVGLRAAGKGIMVHTIDCPSLAEAEDGDWVDLRWAPDVSSGTGRIEVTVMNEPGALAQVTAILAQQGANIVNLQLKDRDRAHHRFVMDVEVDDLKHLAELIAGLRAPALVVSAERMLG